MGVHRRGAGVPLPLSPASATPAVRFDAVTKRFPGVTALEDVTLEVAAGSCHALCGENGAGKSTLGKVLAGIHVPDSGRILVDGAEVRFGRPRDALSAGIGMVHQELAFCENLSVAENLCLAALPARRGILQRQEMIRRADLMLGEIGAEIDVARPLGELTIARQQLVQIAAAVGSGARVIVFDEPTSSQSEREAEQLYALIGRLTARGVTCIYVSHRMAEVFRLSDTVSVLRDGRHVGTMPTAGVSESELVRLMIGRPLAEYFPVHADLSPGEELIRVTNLSSPGRFESVSFAVSAGEVVGLAGLVGAGRSEIAGALFGLLPVTRGEIRFRGRPVRLRSARHAVALGLGLVPEDRKRQGLVPTEGATHNLTLPILKRLSRWSWIRRKAERVLAGGLFARLRVKAPDPDAAVAGLSGGNQQKVVLARWIAARSRLLVLDEPTRGVDVGAKAEIHDLIGNLAMEGHGVLLISSELPELLSLSNRILVLRSGRLVGELPRARASQDLLLRMMAGVGEDES